MDDDQAIEARAITPVDEALQRLRYQLDALAEQLGELRSRLGPVLTPETEGPGEAVEARPEDPYGQVSDLTARLHRETDRAGNLTEQLMRLRGRLEV